MKRSAKKREKKAKGKAAVTAALQSMAVLWSAGVAPALPLAFFG
jgi:hypothetical protein